MPKYSSFPSSDLSKLETQRGVNLDKDAREMVMEDEDDQRSDAMRAEVQAQIIECLNRFYAMETGMWGSPVDCLIIRTVVQGKIQGKLYDISALSDVLDLPISTLHRKIGFLVNNGFLVREPRGKSVYISPTDRTKIALDKSFETMVATLRRLYKGDIDFDLKSVSSSIFQ